MLVLALGFGMIALTVAIHTSGATLWLYYMGRRLKKIKRQVGRRRLFYAISTTAVTLLFLHMIEALLWALLYMQLPGQAGLSSLNEAFYFSMVTFTTLGYGDVTLASEWQSLAGTEAMVGIVVFGLSTAMLYAMIQRSWSYTFANKTKP